MNATSKSYLTDAPLESFLEALWSASVSGYAVIDKQRGIVGVTNGLEELLGENPQLANVAAASDVEGDRTHDNHGVNETQPSRFTLVDLRSLTTTLNSAEINGPTEDHRIGTVCETSVLHELERKWSHFNRLANVGTMTAAIMHGMATPLTLIASHTEMLLENEQLFSDETVRSLSAIRDESARLSSLLQDYLTFARDVPLDIAPVSPSELISKCIELYRAKALLRNISLQIEIEPDLPPVACDSRRLQEVFLNLLGNAFDASPEESSVTVTVRRSPKTLGGGREAVEFVVQDNGHGIAQEDLPRLFEPFFSLKPAGEGTGLGLSISSRIVSSHGGRLQLTSTPGEGTRGIVLLPVWQGSVDEAS